MKIPVVLLALAAGLGASAGAAVEAPAELVLLHGKIHTEDRDRSLAQAMALSGNTIVAVGTDRAVRKWLGPASQVVDLRGRVVLPGIIDAHTHPADGALQLGRCSLGDELLAPAAIKARVAACLRKSPGDRSAWFQVVQVNSSGLALTLNELDSMLAERPFTLYETSGHSLWANSAALAAAGISAATPDPTGGRIEHDAAGNPTGTLRDAAMDIVLNATPPASLEVEARQLDRTLKAMRATGITSVQDAAVDEHLMRIYRRLYTLRRLKMRVRGAFLLSDLGEPTGVLIARAIKFRDSWAVDPDFLRADAIKIYGDGDIEYPGQTASLLEPYLDAAGRPTENRGPSYYTQENLEHLVTAADAAGFSVHVHAIGDRAVRSALDAFAAARRQNGPLDNRHQLAHLELVDPADFPRFRELGVIANLQLLWAQLDDYMTAATIPYLGPERSRHLYPARELYDAGALIAGGSDWNVSSYNAFIAMEHAITRSNAQGEPPLLPEQAIGLQQMVDAYTINAAYALKQERTTGSLEPGKRGDFIVLDRDIFAIDPFQLHRTRVLATYLDGRKVYAARAK